MTIQNSQVFEYLNTHPILSHDGDLASLLELLHQIYIAGNPIDSGKIRACFQNLQQILDRLPIADVDAMFRLVNDICYEYESCAFSHGLLVGMHLMTELNALP